MSEEVEEKTDIVLETIPTEEAADSIMNEATIGVVDSEIGASVSIDVVEASHSPKYQTLAHGVRPWYLKTEDLYEVMKRAADDVRIGDVAVAERAIEVIDGFASAISKNVLRISEEEGVSMVKKVDELTVQLLSSVDHGIDIYRVRLAESLEKLEVIVLANTEWASEIVKERAIEARKSMSTVAERLALTYADTAASVKERLSTTAKLKYDEAKMNIVSAYGKADEYTKEWLNKMATDYPDASASIKVLLTPHPSAERYIGTAESRAEFLSKVGNVVYSTSATVYGGTQKLIQNAQPYVVKAVETSQPYVSKAVEATSPYVAKAVGTVQPYIDQAAEATQPYVNSALGIVKPVLSSPLVIKTSVGITSMSQSAADAVKNYVYPSASDESNEQRDTEEATVDLNASPTHESVADISLEQSVTGVVIGEECNTSAIENPVEASETSEPVVEAEVEASETSEPVVEAEVEVKEKSSKKKKRNKK